MAPPALDERVLRDASVHVDSLALRARSPGGAPRPRGGAPRRRREEERSPRPRCHGSRSPAPPRRGARGAARGDARPPGGVARQARRGHAARNVGGRPGLRRDDRVRRPEGRARRRQPDEAGPRVSAPRARGGTSDLAGRRPGVHAGRESRRPESRREADMRPIKLRPRDPAARGPPAACPGRLGADLDAYREVYARTATRSSSPHSARGSSSSSWPAIAGSRGGERQERTTGRVGRSPRRRHRIDARPARNLRRANARRPRVACARTGIAGGASGARNEKLRASVCSSA